MAQVSITINGRSYDIACDDGQEAHLARLAEYVDRRVAELVSMVGQVGDSRLLVMASLLVADELEDVNAKLAAAGSPGAGTDDALAAELDALAGRLEGVAERLDRP